MTVFATSCHFLSVILTMEGLNINHGVVESTVLAQNQPLTASPDSIAQLLAQTLKEKDALATELAEVKAKRNKADKEYAQRHPEPVKELEKEEKKEEPAPAPHWTGSFQKYCPTCGDANPIFKDETVCSTPGCGQHLGAEEGLKTLKACPNCGGHGYDKIKSKSE